MKNEKKEKIIEKNNNQIASRGRIITAVLLDFLLLMILLTFIFGVCGLNILKSTNVYSSYNANKDEFVDYLVTTRLYEKNDKGELLNSNNSGKDYIKLLVKTTYYYEDMEFIENNTLGQKEVVEIKNEDVINYVDSSEKYKNDRLAYYFLYFREELSDLSDDIKNNYGEQNKYKNSYNYFYNYGLKANSIEYKAYFNDAIFEGSDNEVNVYPLGKSILSKTTAELLHDYLFLNDTSSYEAKTHYNNLLSLYTNALNVAFEELSNNSALYKMLDGKVNDSQNYIYKMQVVTLVISYVVTFLIYYVGISAIFKFKKTLGLKFSRLMLTLVDDNQIRAKNILVREITMLFTQAIVMLIPLIFLGTNFYSILFVDLGGGIRFIYLIIIFFVLSLASFIFMTANKKHQFLPDYLSLIVIKDTDSLKVTEENSVIEN